MYDSELRSVPTIVSLSCPYCAAPVESGVVECGHCGSALELPVSTGDLLDGRFEIRRVLGFGALGTTFTARDRVNKCDVVLKVISPSLAPSIPEAETLGTQLQMFEGRTIQGCAMHLEVGLADDLLYVTYPMVMGVSLRDVLDARAALNQGIEREEALRLLLAIVSATSALHSATPHGALRPENVMLTPRGVVLTNGAIVGSVPPERIQPRLRAFARAVAYVAPEVLAGKKVTATADLFAIGAIAAELLAGTPSPHGLEESGVPADIANSIRQLLERDRTKRPGGQGTLLNALSKLCGFDRRPAEPPLPMVEAPKPSDDDGGDSTTIAPAPSARREAPAPVASPAPVAPPPSMPPAARRPSPAMPVAPPPSMQSPAHQTPTQPSLPAARVGIGRPMAASGPGAPPPPSAVRPSMPGAPPPAAAGPPSPGGPPLPSRPRASVPPPSKSGTTLPPPAMSSGPARPPAPAIPSRPAMPAVPRVSPGQPTVMPPATLGAPPAAPRVPRIPGMGGPAAPASPGPARPAKRDLDGIDPKLLQAARDLQSEPVREFTDVDTGEIELLDD